MSAPATTSMYSIYTVTIIITGMTVLDYQDRIILVTVIGKMKYTWIVSLVIKVNLPKHEIVLANTLHYNHRYYTRVTVTHLYATTH